MDLTEILREPEGKTVEFKRDLSSPNPFLRTVVAFDEQPMPGLDSEAIDFRAASE